MPDPSPPDAPHLPYEPDPQIRRALGELGCTDANELQIGGISAMSLAKRFGTPLYVFSAEVLQQRVAHIRRTLGERFELLWSVKANPSVAVTKCLRLASAGAEIASAGELEVALAAGHQPSDLRFAGPGKSNEELLSAWERGLGTFHVESLQELHFLGIIGEQAGKAVRVALRINLPQELHGARMRMGGHGSRFGIDIEQVPDAIARITANPHLTLAGLHVYGGTQCFDADAFVAHARNVAERAANWERDLGVQFDELDLGGGFGVAVFAGDPTFDLERCAEGLQQVLADFDRPERRWLIELGRYLAAPAGVFLTEVTQTKTSGGQRHAIVDGGMHQAAAAAGLGTIVRRPPLLVVAEALRAETAVPVTVGGPLCTPADQFCDQMPLPELHGAELLAILNAGAYGLTYSPMGFLSHPTPAEVMVEGEQARIVRERGTVTDALRGQQP